MDKHLICKTMLLILGTFFLGSCNRSNSSDQETLVNATSSADYRTEKIFLINGTELMLFHSLSDFRYAYGCFSKGDNAGTSPVYKRKQNADILDLKVEVRTFYMIENGPAICVDPIEEFFKFDIYKSYYLAYQKLSAWNLPEESTVKIKYSETKAPFELNPESNTDYVRYTTSNHKCFEDTSPRSICFTDELKDMPSLTLNIEHSMCFDCSPNPERADAIIVLRKDEISVENEEFLLSHGWAKAPW